MKLAHFFPYFALILSCGKKESEPNLPRVTVGFGNSTPASLTYPSITTPTKFKIKLYSIQLIEDVSSSGEFSGEAPVVWAAPACSTKSESDSEGTTYTGLSSDDICNQAGISYIDLTLTAPYLNDQLSPSTISIPEGTYRYAVLKMLGSQTPGNTTFKNWLWSHSPSSTDEIEGASSLKNWVGSFSTPLEATDGKMSMIHLMYDLSQSVIVNDVLPTSTTDLSCRPDNMVCARAPIVEPLVTFGS